MFPNYHDSGLMEGTILLVDTLNSHSHKSGTTSTSFLSIVNSKFWLCGRSLRLLPIPCCSIRTMESRSPIQKVVVEMKEITFWITSKRLASISPTLYQTQNNIRQFIVVCLHGKEQMISPLYQSQLRMSVE